MKQPVYPKTIGEINFGDRTLFDKLNVHDVFARNVIRSLWARENIPRDHIPKDCDYYLEALDLFKQYGYSMVAAFQHRLAINTQRIEARQQMLAKARQGTHTYLFIEGADDEAEGDPVRLSPATDHESDILNAAVVECERTGIEDATVFKLYECEQEDAEAASCADAFKHGGVVLVEWYLAKIAGEWGATATEPDDVPWQLRLNWDEAEDPTEPQKVIISRGERSHGHDIERVHARRQG